MSTNPLVAPRVASPVDPFAGIWIIEDIQSIASGIRNGSWIEGTLGVVGAGLDALALISDPVGALLQYGISWLIEHVKPLSEALDWLAGDPAQIAAHAQTWRNVAGSLQSSAADLAAAVQRDIAQWRGEAADNYRIWATQQKTGLEGLAQAADTLSTITEAAGMLIAAVRLMVRDAIATVVSRLIVYAAELLATLGAATPLVVEQVATLIASWGARIARWLRALIASLAKLKGIVSRLIHLISELIKILARRAKKLLDRFKRRPHATGVGPVKPSRPPDPNARPRGTPTDAHPTKKKDLPLRRENESAETLAKNGYDVEQNPGPKPNGKNPDYKIEGEYFDNYAPSTKDLDNIRDTVSNKVKTGQADRIVLNLDDCPRSMDEIADVLRRKPVNGLQEVLVVQGGKVTRLFP